jgi:hypothetical protein
MYLVKKKGSEEPFLSFCYEVYYLRTNFLLTDGLSFANDANILAASVGSTSAHVNALVKSIVIAVHARVTLLVYAVA